MSAKSVTNKLSSKRRRAPVDVHAATELDLYIENDSRIYQQKRAICELLRKKVEKGVYDEAKAAKLWLYWVTDGAKHYVEEMGSHGDTMESLGFNKPTREKVAEVLARHYSPAKLLARDF